MADLDVAVRLKFLTDGEGKLKAAAKSLADFSKSASRLSGRATGRFGGDLNKAWHASVKLGGALDKSAKSAGKTATGLRAIGTGASGIDRTRAAVDRLSCKVTEQAGDESDEAEIICVGPPSKFGLPGRGEKFTILGGWEDEGPVMQGEFTVQKIVCGGDPEEGDRITIVLRAADYVDKLKAHASKHYDDKTYGDIIEDVAKQAGLEAQVDSEVAKIKVPYRLRWNQSHIDFATELSEEVGAICKPAGGKLIAVKRGAGKSASGKNLTPIEIIRRKGFAYEIEIEPRPEVGDVAASWHDEKAGKRKVAKHKAGRKGPLHAMPHPFRSEDEAKKAAESEAYEMGNDTGSGHFDSPGLPHAHAEAPVNVSGFGKPIDGRWNAESVEKVWDANGGFVTTVHVKAGDEEKGKKG